MILHVTACNARTSPEKQTVVRQMWDGGPLRRWSPTKTPQTPMGYSTGFVGSYVCGQCLESCEGVYRLREPEKWVCGACKRKIERSEVCK